MINIPTSAMSTRYIIEIKAVDIAAGGFSEIGIMIFSVMLLVTSMFASKNNVRKVAP